MKMNTRHAILSLLASGEPLSGEEIAKQLGFTRAAVWKQMEKLREAGYDVRASGKQGYLLRSCADDLRFPFLQQGLGTLWAGQSSVYFDEVDSTNRQAKDDARSGAPHGHLVLANSQSEGRGRLGRAWTSPKGDNVYMTLVLRPQMLPQQASMLTLLTAVCVARAIDRLCGPCAGIKWPNDVVVRGMKVCGILLEIHADMDGIVWAVLGAGINVRFARVPEEIALTAGALENLLDMAHRSISRVSLVQAFLQEIESLFDRGQREGWDFLLGEYRHKSVTLGRQVHAFGEKLDVRGIARDVLEDGSLIIDTQEGQVRVLAGDVSVRGVMGYV